MTDSPVLIAQGWQYYLLWSLGDFAFVFLSLNINVIPS